MGNEQSQLYGLEIDEKAIEVTDFWSHHSAVMHSDNITNLSVFIGEPFVGGALWINHTPLEKATKNLKLHRHPCILKYISSWNKNSKCYLAVEYVKPLSHVIQTQTTLQICIGLHNILKALIFLHENAVASHNNICSACIYVTPDGSWKLAGLEYLCRIEDLSYDYLKKTRLHRYEKAIDPNEEKYSLHNETYFRSGAIDKYAFAVLVSEVLSKRSNEDVPGLDDFIKYCKEKLQNSEPSERINLQNILQHDLFNHNFVVIYSFLTELPLKQENEKANFFSNLVIKLRTFPEEVVARQLGDLLLSRLVLLDKTAKNCLLPFILVPKKDSIENDNQIFREDIYKQYIIPKLLHIFKVRDAQIRLLLLSYFKHCVKYFSKNQLQNQILPELLLGIKDTNDNLVSVTLTALSDLVPILGGAVVIGGTRIKLFNDGRPAGHSMKKSNRMSSRQGSVSQEVSDFDTTNSSTSYSHHIFSLPERPSPVGGEEISATEIDDSVVDDDLGNWSDWDGDSVQTTTDDNQVVISNNFNLNHNSSEISNGNENMDVEQMEIQTEDINQTPISTIVSSALPQMPQTYTFNKNLPDISELDIKNQKNNQKEKIDDFDFFQDMEPVIELNNVTVVENQQLSTDEPEMRNLNFSSTIENISEEGWGDDLEWMENSPN